MVEEEAGALEAFSDVTRVGTAVRVLAEDLVGGLRVMTSVREVRATAAVRPEFEEPLKTSSTPMGWEGRPEGTAVLPFFYTENEFSFLRKEHEQLMLTL